MGNRHSNGGGPNHVPKRIVPIHDSNAKKLSLFCSWFTKPRLDPINMAQTCPPPVGSIETIFLERIFTENSIFLKFFHKIPIFRTKNELF